MIIGNEIKANTCFLKMIAGLIAFIQLTNVLISIFFFRFQFQSTYLRCRNICTFGVLYTVKSEFFITGCRRRYVNNTVDDKMLNKRYCKERANLVFASKEDSGQTAHLRNMMLELAF